ncbi:MAG: Gfo/Idh/MocA family oxidoreductase [Bryobacteraceae bacterium]
MAEGLRVAVLGLGRMGSVHARNLLELERETGACRLAALVDPDEARARRFAREHGCEAMVLRSLGELAQAGICEGAVIATPTEMHREHAERLIAAGYRVLLEKPLTGTIEADEAFAAALDRDYPRAVMLGFQRRFDAPLRHAKELLEKGCIGRVFKIFSALEDSGPPPDGYRSSGLLADMSVHNVDEILWLTGCTPKAAVAIGSRVYGHRVSTCAEDFDDALLLMWFEQDLVAQVQVSRNHVSGYRVETVVFGEEGQIHVGRFDQRPTDVVVEAYGRRKDKEPIAYYTFSMAEERADGPEFLDRFGPAYRAEIYAFVECCRERRPFPVTHVDGLRAQRVIEAGMRRLITAEGAGLQV